jgi:hypothetical protein
LYRLWDTFQNYWTNADYDDDKCSPIGGIVVNNVSRTLVIIVICIVDVVVNSFKRTLVIIVICFCEVVVNSFRRTLVIIVICIGEVVVNSFRSTLVIIAICIGPVILECIPGITLRSLISLSVPLVIHSLLVYFDHICIFNIFISYFI